MDSFVSEVEFLLREPDGFLGWGEEQLLREAEALAEDMREPRDFYAEMQEASS